MVSPEDTKTSHQETPDVITPKDDTPILDDWNRPLKRTAPTKEQQERMQELIKFNQLSPEEKLKQLINFTPDEDDSTMSDKNAPKISFDDKPAQTDPALEANLQRLGVKDTPQEELDTNPLYDLTKKIHDPGMDVKSIKASATLTAQDLRDQSEDVQILEAQGPIPSGDQNVESNLDGTDGVDSVSAPIASDSDNGSDERNSDALHVDSTVYQDNEKVINDIDDSISGSDNGPDSGVSDQSSDTPSDGDTTPSAPSDNVHSDAVSLSEGDNEASREVSHTEDAQEVQVVQGTNDDIEIGMEHASDSTSLRDSSSDPKLHDAPDQNGSLDTPHDSDSGTDLPSVEPASSVSDQQESTPQMEVNPTSSPSTDTAEPDVSLQDALLEIQETTNPYAADDVSDQDFESKVEVPEKTEEPQVEEPTEVDEDGVLTKKTALTTIASIYDTAIFGQSDNGIIFDPDDMDVKVDTEIARAHIVLSNMTGEERLRYVLQTNTQALEDTAKNLYGTTGEFYDVTHDALLDLAENVIDPKSYINRVHNSNGQFGNPAATAKTDALRHAKEDFKAKYPDKEFKLSRNVKIKGASPNGTDLTVDHKFADKSKLFQQISENGIASIKGPSATKITSLLINGYRQVNFYHSGFHVNLNAPRMDQLSRYYNRVSENMMDYGRILGQYAYLPVGVETRSALMDLFCECVESSNLKGWEDRTVLMKALSVLDQPVAIWAMASLMYPKGVEVDYLCHNNLPNGKKCRHVEKTKVDINSMCYNDWSKISAEAIIYTVSKEERTLEDLAKYRAKYLKSDGTTFPINKSEEWRAQFFVPSCFEAEEKQRAYVTQMAKEFQLSNLQKADDYFRSKTYLAYLPFVKKVTYVEDGKTIEFEDPSALEPALNNLQLVEGVSLPERLTNYMDEKTITHICFSYMPCPKCGKVAPDAIDRLIPCDPEYTFFIWTAARLQS